MQNSGRLRTIITLFSSERKLLSPMDFFFLSFHFVFACFALQLACGFCSLHRFIGPNFLVYRTGVEAIHFIVST